MCVSTNQTRLFTGDNVGNLIQCPQNFQSSSNEILIYEKIFETGIFKICNSNDSRYLYACNMGGQIKQIKIHKDGTLSLKATYDCENKGVIKSIIVNNKGNYLFSCDSFGNVKQWSTKSCKLYKDWGEIHDEAITSMAVSLDDNYQFTGDSSGNLSIWDIKSNFSIENLQDYHNFSITNIVLTRDGEFVYTCDDDGYAKKLCLGKNNEFGCCYNFGKIHDGLISTANVSLNDNSFFTGDANGIVKQWSVKTGKLINDWGVIHSRKICAIDVLM